VPELAFPAGAPGPGGQVIGGGLGTGEYCGFAVFAWVVAVAALATLRRLPDYYATHNHRYRACDELGSPVRTRQFHGPDPLACFISANLNRAGTSMRARG
jgi:hypothetical protein